MNEENMEPMAARPKRKKSMMGPIIALLVLLIIAAVVVVLVLKPNGGSSTAFNLNSSELSEAQNAQAELDDKEVERVVRDAKKHILLPDDVDPVVARIDNVDVLLQQQPFYSGAVNGDYLLIYVPLQKAIIYSPNRDMLINVGPFQVQQSQVQQ